MAAGAGRGGSGRSCLLALLLRLLLLLLLLSLLPLQDRGMNHLAGWCARHLQLVTRLVVGTASPRQWVCGHQTEKADVGQGLWTVRDADTLHSLWPENDAESSQRFRA